MKLLLTLVLIVVFGSQEIKAQRNYNNEIIALKKDLKNKIGRDTIFDTYFNCEQKAIETQAKFINAVSGAVYEYSKLDSLELLLLKIKKNRRNKVVLADLSDQIKNQEIVAVKAKEATAEAQQESDVASHHLELLNKDLSENSE